MKFFTLSFSLSTLILLVIVSSVQSQYSQQSEKSQSTVVLTPAELDSVVEWAMETYHIPGVVLLSVNHEQIVYKREYGWANIGDSVPATDTTVFLLSSISKTFVANAAMQLWENDTLDLDTDINNYLPFSVTNPYFPDSVITMRTLLSHTSSLARNDQVWIDSITSGGDSPIPLSQFLEAYLVPGGGLYHDTNYLPNPPGTKWLYSNFGFALAALVVEEITGQAFEQYCQDSLFTPLGMSETSWFLSGLPNLGNIATGYDWNGSNYTTYGNFGYPVYPSGLLRSSAVQLAKHEMAFMNYGEVIGSRILDSTTVEEMRTPQFPGADGIAESYLDVQGIGWYEQYGAGWDRWGHGGAQWGSGTRMFFHPDERSGWLMLTNRWLNPGHDVIQNAFGPFSRDQDMDSVISGLDNCPDVPNRDQADFDGDGVGDACCCVGIRGDLNGDGDDANIIDLTFLVDFIFRSSGDRGGCPSESDVNSDGTPSNILDLTFVVDKIFRSGPLPEPCLTSAK